MPESSLTPLARAMRRSMTEPERRLWFRLKNRQLEGAKFVRQLPVERYIADFCCRSAKLIVEIDGWTHNTPEEIKRDAERTACLMAEGYRVLRFNNDEIMRNIEGVLETISAGLGD